MQQLQCKQGIGELNLHITQTQNHKELMMLKYQISALTISLVYSFTKVRSGSLLTIPKVSSKHVMNKLEITENKIIRTLKQLNINKLPGPNGMGPGY